MTTTDGLESRSLGESGVAHVFVICGVLIAVLDSNSLRAWP